MELGNAHRLSGGLVPGPSRAAAWRAKTPETAKNGTAVLVVPAVSTAPSTSQTCSRTPMSDGRSTAGRNPVRRSIFQGGRGDRIGEAVIVKHAISIKEIARFFQVCHVLLNRLKTVGKPLNCDAVVQSRLVRCLAAGLCLWLRISHPGRGGGGSTQGWPRFRIGCHGIRSYCISAVAAPRMYDRPAPCSASRRDHTLAHATTASSPTTR